MTSVIKSVSDTTNNVLTTVGSLANQITRTVNTAGEGLDMLNSFVSTARTKQKARTAIDLETFYEELAEETAITTAERQIELARKLNADNDLKKVFSENHTKYTTLLTKIRNPESE